ncbi:MAG: hypothetical protein J3Q66DRAFT_353104 [Benniella sp.]|nr:MAG: hypothetical protein J3Q66DRAFT_353104 [Benniella sp.]
MLIPLSSPATNKILTFTLTFLFCTLSTPSTLAQKFRPEPDYDKCSAFVEGQAFYLFGGELRQNFVFDLSVPWNASNPVIKEVDTGLVIVGKGCTTTDNGDLFVLTVGAGFIYNLKSNSWTPFEHPDFATSTPGQFGVRDPETGIIYIKEEAMDFRSESTMYSIDLRTKTVNTSKVYSPLFAQGITWSESLKSIVAVDRPIYLFTPSKVAEPSGGRSTFVATSKDGDLPTSLCAAPAYGGSIIVFIGKEKAANSKAGTYAYILDVDKQTWKRGPLGDELDHDGPACAVSGDYFIVWGRLPSWRTDKTLVFNIKTEKWVSKYIPPRPRATTTILQPSHTPTQQTNTVPGPSNTSSGDKKPVAIIVAVTGCLLTIIVGLIV